MTLSRILPIINLAGCVAITTIIIAQWLKERGLDHRIGNLRTELAETREQLDAEKNRALGLENDVAQLKESIESTMAARKEAEEAMKTMLAEREAQVAAASNASADLVKASEEQVKVWEKAIAERDARIRELNASLAATRERLNEAVAKLREAAAR